MNSKNVVLKYGIILSGALIAYSLIINALGVGLEQSIASIAYLFIPIFLYISIKKNQIALNTFSFGSGFKTGFKTTAIVSLIVPVFSYIYLTYIDPDMIQLIIEKTETDLYAQNMSEDEIEIALNMQKMVMKPITMAFFSAISYLFIGTIVSLIIAAIVKKPEENTEY